MFYMMQMNEGEIRIRGLEAIREWVSKDDRYISMIGECEIIKDAVSILRRRTIGEGEEGEKEGEEGNGKECGEEEGVSVREKNGILGIVLEMVEGGGWKGSYSELEEVVGRLEEEGKKEWISKRREKGINSGREWKEMGRLAHSVGWAIEERRGREEGRGGDGEMIISLREMKKNLEEEKKKVEEEKKGREAEKKRADEEQRMKEEEMKKVDEMKKGREEEKRKKEEAERRETEEKKKREEEERRAGEEKERMEERIRNLEQELSVWKPLPITSLDGTSVVFTPSNEGIRREGNIILHHRPDKLYRNCFIGGEMTSL